MAENTGIEWAHHTFNPWIGCQKVSPACDNCYAEAWDKRFAGDRWGPHAARTRTKGWSGPRKWQKAAARTGIRQRVFCASLADVFDNHRSIEQTWRDDLWSLIRECPDLDWLMLTKRPMNITRLLPDDWDDGYPNVWLGTTVENQAAADRAECLAGIPARIRFLSMEPLLGPVELTTGVFAGGAIHWVIVGGENAILHRPMHLDWVRSIRDQCATTGVPFLFKQWAGRSQKTIKLLGREVDGVEHNGYPHT